MSQNELQDTATGETNNYLTDEYKQSQFNGDQVDNPELPSLNPEPTPPPPETKEYYGTVLDPSDQPVSMPSSTGFIIPESEQSMWNEGFQGSSMDELHRYRVQNQPTYIKGLYTVGGGILSGVGTMVEDTGYLLDYNTYAAVFSDVDFSSGKSLNLIQSGIEGIQEYGRSIKHSTERDVLPVYETPADSESYSDMLFKWGTLKSIIDSAVGFTAVGAGVSSVVKGAAKGATRGITKLGKKAALSTKGMKGINNLALKASRTEAYVNLIGKTNPQLFPTLGATTSGLITKGAEARMEGLEAYENTLYKMQPLVENGVITSKEAEKSANIAANEAFEYTMMTAVGDMVMLKSMFFGKGLATKKLSAPTRWNRNKSTLFGAPKEGFEEMWQEAAKMEGNYNAFKSVKNNLKTDEDLKKFKSLAKDPSEYPERWMERFGGFLGSTQALVSGTIGLLSGPLQAKGLQYMPGSKRKERIQHEYEQYKAQQESYKRNETLFGKQYQFKEQAKQIGISQELRNISQLLANTDLENVTEDASFLSIATNNFMDGTQDNLKEIIKESKHPESNKLISKLNKLERQFIDSKKYANPNEVFVIRESIKLRESLNKQLREYRNNPDLDKKIAKSYDKALKDSEQELARLKDNYDTITNRSYQLSLVEAFDRINTLEDVSARVDEESSITILENMKDVYPELDTKIDSKITDLKNIGNIGKTTTTNTTNVNSTVNSSEASPGDTIEGNVETIADKIVSGFPLDAKEKEFVKNNPNTIKEAIVEKEFSTKEGVLADGTKMNKHNIPILDKNSFITMMGGDIQPILDSFHKQSNRGKVGSTPEMMDQVYDAYLKNSANITSTDLEGLKFLEPVIQKIYADATNIVPSQENNTITEPEVKTTVSDESTAQSSDIISDAANNFLDLLDSNDEIEEDLPTNKSSVMQELEALDTLVKALKVQGFDINKASFKDFLKALESHTKRPETVQKHFIKIKGLYMAYTNKEIPGTYAEIMGITEKDPFINSETLTPSKVKHTIDVATRYVSPTQSSKELTEIYSNEEITNVESKNLTPAESVAHLSQEYVWEYKGKKEVSRLTSNSTIKGNTVLNPNKYNTGDSVQLELHTDYDGNIRLPSGSLVKWKDLLNEHIKGNWEQVLKKYKLPYDYTIDDVYPVTITGLNTTETIGYAHDTSWINSLNTNEDIIKENVKKIKEFRNRVVPQLLNNPNKILTTDIIEKVIGINKEGVYTGFALNSKNKLANTSDSLPDNLTIGVKVFSNIEVPGQELIINNTMNSKFIEGYHSGTPFIFVPLGKKGNSMKYHAEPLIGSKLKPSQSKMLAQVINIFITDNPEVNINLYERFKQEGMDLLNKKDVSNVLKKYIQLYRSDSKDGVDRKSLEETIKGRLGKESLGFLEFTNDTIKFGKSNVITLKKGKLPTEKDLRILESNILPSMYFNINKTLLNNTDSEVFMEVNPETDEVNSIETDYNSYVKQNTETFMRSTQLDDGSYSSTIQNIVRINLNETKEETVEGLVIEETEKIEKEETLTIQTISKETEKKIEILAEASNKTKEEFMKPVDNGSMALEPYLKAMGNVSKAKNHSNKYKNC